MRYMPLFLRIWIYRFQAHRDPEWIESWSDTARVDAAIRNHARCMREMNDVGCR